MQMYANNCDTKLHPQPFHANDVCQTGILERPIPPPHLSSIPPLSTSQTFQLSLVSLARDGHVLFLVISQSPPLLVSFNPLSTLFSHLASHFATRFVHPRLRKCTPHPLGNPALHSSPRSHPSVCCMDVSGVRRH